MRSRAYAFDERTRRRSSVFIAQLNVSSPVNPAASISANENLGSSMPLGPTLCEPVNGREANLPRTIGVIEGDEATLVSHKAIAALVLLRHGLARHQHTIGDSDRINVSDWSVP